MPQQSSHQKVGSHHLKRIAYLYIRQSTLRQVFENSESTRRQYDLRQRAVALGWAVEQISVIDDDLGLSAASADGRQGFQRLVAEVGLGRAGIVMGLEVSRLARNSIDWHRLLEICAVTDTLILDEDGVYDPSHFNDRLLLGLKGTMSEAELHVLRARLRGGILNKARRGELKVRLPVGLVYSPDDRVVLDPDTQVQESVRALFRMYRETGSATATVKAFHNRGISFPRRLQTGKRPAPLLWSEIRHSTVLNILKNPRYAGAFAFGRHRTRRLPNGKTQVSSLPREEWIALIHDSHEGYITWAEFEENQSRLAEARPGRATRATRAPAREGPALLQGLVICGRCGQRMTVRYHSRKDTLVPEYRCAREGVARGVPICQFIPGASIDAAMGDLLVKAISPKAIEVALSVCREVRARIEEADRLRGRQVERARYEADLARTRYMQVDPNNRLVADVLEADWNAKLRALTSAQEAYDARRAADRADLSEDQRQAIHRLASDFPAIWRDPRTPQRERKRILRLLIEDITLLKAEQVHVHIRFRGGSTRSLTLPRQKPAGEARKTSPELVAEIDRLLDDHTLGEIPALLEKRGFKSGTGKTPNRRIVRKIYDKYGLRPRYDRLRATGLLTVCEVAHQLDVSVCTVKIWRRSGRLRALRYNDKEGCLYEEPGPDAPEKYEWHKGRKKGQYGKVSTSRADEV